MGVQQDATQLDVTAGLHEKINIGGDDVVRPSRRHHSLDAPNGFIHGQRIEGNAQQRDRGGFAARFRELPSLRFVLPREKELRRFEN